MKQAFFFLVTVVILSGCFAPKTTSTAIQRLPAKFDFSPPSRTKAGAANMTIALLRPAFVGKEHPENYTPPFDQMAGSMEGHFLELLTAKGFTVRGPFGSRDEMTYNEKTNSDFALEVHIILNPQWHIKYSQSVNWGALISSSSNATYTTTGDVIFEGYLELNAKSPQYGELIWKKRIDLQPSTCSYAGKIKWNGQPTITDELKQDNEVYNTISKELEKFYTQAMNLAWQQIDAAEMKTVAEQARKADKKG